jgi:hypothetical protein
MSGNQMSRGNLIFVLDKRRAVSPRVNPEIENGHTQTSFTKFFKQRTIRSWPIVTGLGTKTPRKTIANRLQPSRPSRTPPPELELSNLHVQY